MHRRSIVVFWTFLATVMGAIPARAQTTTFSDVPATHPAFAAVEYVKDKGIFKGYADGTFRLGNPLKRSETVKILVSMKLSEQDVQQYSKRSFTDVPADAWYRAYAEAAMLKLGIIDGPPKATVFNGDNAVTKVQFLKMFLKTQSTDAAGTFGEIQLPLATDVTDPTAWYYPYVRYALSSSLIQVQNDGMLRPDATLTRGDAALIIHRLAMYQAGRRTQVLLSQEESELMSVLQMLENKELAQAEYASARALIAARGAHRSKPNVAIVQAAVKTSEAFRALVRAYRAGSEGKAQEVITLSKDAWGLAEKARQLSPELTDLTSRVQTIAKAMADQARELQKQTP